MGTGTTWAKIKCTGGQVPIDETDPKSKCKLPEGNNPGGGDQCLVSEYAQCDNSNQCNNLHLAGGNGLCTSAGCFEYDDANDPACDINDKYRCNELTSITNVTGVTFSSDVCVATVSGAGNTAKETNCNAITGTTASGTDYEGKWEEFGTCDYEAERPSNLADDVTATKENTCNVLIGNAATFAPTKAICTWGNITPTGTTGAASDCPTGVTGSWTTTEATCSKTNGYANLAACTALHDVGTGGGYVPSEATCTWTGIAYADGSSECATNNTTGATWTTTEVDCEDDDGGSGYDDLAACRAISISGTVSFNSGTCKWTGVTVAAGKTITEACTFGTGSNTVVATPTPTEGKCVKAEVTVAAGKTAAEACAAAFASADPADNAVYSKGTCTWKEIAVAAGQTSTAACNAIVSGSSKEDTKGKCVKTDVTITGTQTAQAACTAVPTTPTAATTAIFSKGTCGWTSTTEDTCTDSNSRTGAIWTNSNTEKCVIEFDD